MAVEAQSHIIESELTGTMARQVARRQGKSMFTIGCMRIFIIPFIVIGIGFVLALIGNVGFWTVNHVTEGRVTGKQTVSDSDGGDTYYVDYVYQLGGETYRNRDSVNQATYGSAETGTTMPVAYLPSRPGLYSVALLPGRSAVRHIGFILLFGLFWNAVVSVFVFVAYVAPYLEWRLYKRGEIAVGIITKKGQQSGEDGPTYFVEYTSEPGQILPPITGKTTVTKAEWDAACVGDRLTVLYDPRRPKRNVAYRYGNYVVVRTEGVAS